MQLAFFLVISRVLFSTAFYNNGYQILDLYEDFNTDLSFWTISPSGNGKTTVCDGYTLLGGKGVLEQGGYLERTYDIKYSHNSIYLLFSFYFNDSWDQEDGAILLIDGERLFRFEGVNYLRFGGSIPDSCGVGDWKDIGYTRFLVQFPHSSSQLRLTFKNDLDEDKNNENFGILEVSINAVTLNTPVTPSFMVYGKRVHFSPNGGYTAYCYPIFAETDCGNPLPNCRESDADGNCYLCKDYTFYFDGSTCQKCPRFCVTCVDQDTCISKLCADNRIYFWDDSCEPTCDFPLVFVDRNGAGTCTFPCYDNQFLYWDGTCQSSCISPLVRKPFKGKTFCEFPCALNQILAPNGTCLNSCESPYTIRISNGVKYCVANCPLPNFLYWNESCLSFCRDPPLLYTTDGAVKYCDYPCDVSEYLFNSGPSISSCCSSCNFPLVFYTEASRQYCDTNCPDPNWAYWNGSCFATCDYPLNQTTPCGARVCENTCAPPNYLYWNQSCLSTCDFPNYYYYDDSGYRYCNNPCDIPYYFYWNASCLPVCDYPYKNRTQSGKYYCDFPCSSSQFLYENGTCISSCKLPWKKEVREGNNYCNFPCPNSQYALSDGSCSSSCESPYSRVNWDNRRFCEYGCLDGWYLNYNGSCIPSCNPPYIRSLKFGKPVCLFPCPPPLSLSWNGSCTFFCVKPLLLRQEFGVYFCDFPCLPNQFLTFDGDCLDSCNTPKKVTIIGDRKICIDACDNGYIMNYNGTCILTDDCKEPYAKVIIEGSYLCRFPCQRNQYLYEDNKCYDNCYLPMKKSPNVQSNYQFCLKPCAAGLYLYSNSSCLPNCTKPFLTRVTNNIDVCYFDCRKPRIIVSGNCICPDGYQESEDGVGCDRVDSIGNIIGATKSLGTVILSSAGVFLVGGASPTIIWGLVHLMQIFYYLVFMNVNYPESVVKFLQLFDLATMSFLPNPLDSWLGGKSTYNTSSVITANVSLDNFTLNGELISPPNFMNNGYSGTFMQSGGSFFQIWFLIFFVYSVSRLVVNRITDTRRPTYKFFNKVVGEFEWNILLRVWLSTLLRMCFASFLQVGALNFSSYRFGISSVLGLLVAVLNVAIAVLSVVVLMRNGRYDLAKVLPLVENLKDDGFVRRYYTIFIIWKRIILSSSLIIFYYLPAIQNLIPLSLYLASVIILFLYRPFVTKNENFNEMITDSGLLVIHCIIMIYTWSDIDAHDYDTTYKESLGNMIIIICVSVLGIRFGNLMFGMLKSVFFVIYNAIKNTVLAQFPSEQTEVKSASAKKYTKKKKRIKGIENGLKKLQVRVTYGF